VKNLTELRARGVCEGKHFTVVYSPRELNVENPRARTRKSNGTRQNKLSPAGAKRTQQNILVKQLPLSYTRPSPGMGHFRAEVEDRWVAPGQTKAFHEQSVPSCPGGLPHKQDWPVKAKPSSNITLHIVTDPCLSLP